MYEDFLIAEFCGKGAKLSKLEKTAQKVGATDQLRYNSFCVIMVSAL